MESRLRIGLPGRTIRSSRALGRVYSVVRETWRLSDDPKTMRPRRRLMAAGRTASEAADLARELAAGHRRHGFHRPTGAWWASDGQHIHRFSVTAGRSRPSLVRYRPRIIARLARLLPRKPRAAGA